MMSVMVTSLPAWSRVLVVVAHPDDESFGLGAVIDRFVQDGAAVHVLCLTKGEASTLGADEADLALARANELAEAARLLGVSSTELRDYPDGGLSDLDADELAAVVRATVAEHAPEGLLVFDDTGITGHPDHVTATRLAVRVARRRDLPVLPWALPAAVADQLNAETGAGFHGHPDEVIALVLDVERNRQRDACRAHVTQSPPGSVLWRRLDLLGGREHLRWL